MSKGAVLLLHACMFVYQCRSEVIVVNKSTINPQDFSIFAIDALFLLRSAKMSHDAPAFRTRSKSKATGLQPFC